MKKLTLVYTNAKPFSIKGEDAFGSVSDSRHTVDFIVDAPKQSVGGSVKVAPSQHITVEKSELMGYAIRDNRGNSEVVCLVPSRKKELMKVLQSRNAV